MKRIYFLLCVFLLSSLAVAQQRHLLVGRDGEIVPLQKGEGMMQAVARAMHDRMAARAALAAQGSCGGAQTFGFDLSDYPSSGFFNTYHKDILAINMLSPTDGTIDTVYTYLGGDVDKDSLLSVRIMQSRIYPKPKAALVDEFNNPIGIDTNGSGPGYGKFKPYLPGLNDLDSGGVAPTNTGTPICWGYFTNTNDIDGQTYNPTITPGMGIGGVAAFPTDATPKDSTAWNSTLHRQYPLSPAAFPPTGGEIWGLGGFAFHHLHPNATNQFNLHILGAPTLIESQPFMMVFIMPGEHWDPNDNANDPARTWWSNSNLNPDADNLYHNTHDWKWYEHGGPSGSCGVPGWVDRGYWEFNVWFSMTVTGNTPPRVLDVTNLGSTILNSPRDVIVDLEDCNFAHPESAGVAWAHMAYRVNEGPYTMLPLTYVAGTTYHGRIPAVQPLFAKPYEETVQFYIAAGDQQGLTNDTGITRSYRVLSFGNEWFYPDTALHYVSKPIRDSVGAVYVDTSAANWFPPPLSYSGVNKHPLDDGTAGPFSLGGPFVYFGDTVYYAWIGVNGAIGLSKTATDTIDVNSNGFYTDYDLPSAQHHGRQDTAGATNLPRNFIAPLWYDLYYVDTFRTQSGRVFCKSDPCNFTVEWDSLGEEYDGGEAVPNNNIYFPDAATFRVILSKCDGTMEFQWDNIQEAWELDTISTVAFECDSGRIIRPDTVTLHEAASRPGWLKYYRGSDQGYKLKPRDSSSVKFIPTTGVVVASVASGWNIISLPTSPPEGNYAKTNLFPAAVSQAFSYAAGYHPQGTLVPGVGYWLKFPAPATFSSPGSQVLTGVDSLKPDWNLIGTIGKSVLPANVGQDPTNIISGSYFMYNHGYKVPTSLDPGVGYWIKSKGVGALHFTASPVAKSTPATTNFSALNKITITDAGKNEQSLYIGSASDVKVPASMYEMPPPPPDGMFDARFASQQMVETYPAQVEAGKLYEYPIDIQTNAYPVTVQWQMASADGHALTMTDGIGGRAVNNVVLNGNGSIKITNASVKSLVLRMAQGRPIPREFALSQNYPNPFNPTTRFNVDVPRAADVQLIVYDILGQRIATLLSGTQAAGYHTVEWDGRDARGMVVPSGMYFVRMTADQFSSVRKVMMLK